MQVAERNRAIVMKIQALTLRELEGMSYDEIALAMNCPIGTVRSRIFRARDHVVQEISQQFPGTFL